MDRDLYLYQGALKRIREKRDDAIKAISRGAVADWPAFRELRAQITVCDALEQDIIALLNKVEEE